MNFHFLKTSKEQGRKRKPAMKVLLNQHVVFTLTTPPSKPCKRDLFFSVRAAPLQVFIFTTDLGEAESSPRFPKQVFLKFYFLTNEPLKESCICHLLTGWLSPTRLTTRNSSLSFKHKKESNDTLTV